jgi:hypothetical protein
VEADIASAAAERASGNRIDYYPDLEWSHVAAFAAPSPARKISSDLPQRLCRSYQTQIASFGGFGSSFWATFANKLQVIHDALMASDYKAIAQLAADPCATNLFWGFDSAVALSGDHLSALRSNPHVLSPSIRSTCDRIVRLAEALGMARLRYPEARAAATSSRKRPRAPGQISRNWPRRSAGLRLVTCWW